MSLQRLLQNGLHRDSAVHGTGAPQRGHGTTRVMPLRRGTCAASSGRGRATAAPHRRSTLARSGARRTASSCAAPPGRRMWGRRPSRHAGASRRVRFPDRRPAAPRRVRGSARPTTRRGRSACSAPSRRDASATTAPRRRARRTAGTRRSGWRSSAAGAGVVAGIRPRGDHRRADRRMASATVCRTSARIRRRRRRLRRGPCRIRR